MEIPSVFNKPDFFGRLLPGYVSIILYLVLFRSNLLHISNQQTLSLDLFSTVIFIIAGPALGLSLALVNRSFYYIHFTFRDWIKEIPHLNRKIRYKKAPGVEEKKANDDSEPNKPIKRKAKSSKPDPEKYEKLRTCMNDSDRMELDQTEAELDFFRSTPMGVLIVDAYYLICRFFFMCGPHSGTYHLPVLILSIIFSVILVVGAHIQYTKAWCPLYNNLKEKYKINSEHC